MKDLDKKMAAIIKALQKLGVAEAKRPPLVSELRMLRECINGIRMGGHAEKILTALLTKPEVFSVPPTSDAILVVRELLDQRFIEIAAALFEQWRELFREVPFAEVIQVAPDAKALESWRKAVGMRSEEMEERLLADLSAAYETAGADWLLLRGKPGRSLPILRFYLGRHIRPKHLPQWADAIADRFSHDRRGVLLGCLLSVALNHRNEIEALAGVIRTNHPLLLTVIDLMPRIVTRRNASPSVLDFVREIFAPVIESQGSDRELLTAALARLGSGVLLERSGGQTKACLEFVQQTSRRLRNVTREEDLRAQTWVLENLCEDDLPNDAGLHITIDGARQLALAMDKAQHGFDAKEILAVAARNLGLVPIGKKGEKVDFLPIRHQDVEGGMLPGDKALIEEAGWSYQDDVIVRAKVKHNKE
jgi:hypothetical protein